MGKAAKTKAKGDKAKEKQAVALDELVAAALAVRKRAHVPYSRFRVGAALRAADGSLHVGCNVENAAYPQGTCAEASAIVAMVAAGQKRLVEIVVAGGGDGPCTPCGGCRQRIREFAGPDARIRVVNPKGLPMGSWTMDELLPVSFGPDNLK